MRQIRVIELTLTDSKLETIRVDIARKFAVLILGLTFLECNHYGVAE
ncbi:MAG: hypothetical protein NVS2B14_06940 [Chamaesiphon sp.]